MQLDQPGTLFMKSALPATTPAEISEWPFKYFVALSHTTSMPTSAGLQLHATLGIAPTWLTCKQELAQVQFNQTILHFGVHSATMTRANKKNADTCKQEQNACTQSLHFQTMQHLLSGHHLGLCAKCSVKAMYNKHKAFWH